MPGPSARRTNNCVVPRTRRRSRGLAAGEALRMHSGSSSSDASTAEPDINQLTTALNNAIAAEDYALAAQLRDQLRAASGDGVEAAADWYQLGILDWLADRAERIGYRFPTGDMHFPDACEALQLRGPQVSLASRPVPKHL